MCNGASIPDEQRRLQPAAEDTLGDDSEDDEDKDDSALSSSSQQPEAGPLHESNGTAKQESAPGVKPGLGSQPERVQILT